MVNEERLGLRNVDPEFAFFDQAQVGFLSVWGLFMGYGGLGLCWLWVGVHVYCWCNSTGRH